MSKGRSTIYRGAAGRAKAEEELALQKQLAEQRKERGNQPFRFKIGVGETSQFIILDAEPGVYRYEHALQDPKTKFWNIFTGCVKEFDNCPVCEATRDSYYALYLTVIDLTEFTTKAGETVEFSRKLLVVKPSQQKKFNRIYSRAVKDGGSLRGALIEATRDGEKDASIGNDFELVEFVPEEDLQTYVRKWKDREGKKHTEKCYEVYDYDALFGEVTSDSLRAIVGGSPAPGSRQHEERELGSRRTASKAKSRRASDDEDDDEDDDDAAYSSPSRKERMSTKARGGRANEDDDDEDEEEAKPARTTRGRPSAKTRSRAEEDDDEDEEEAKPKARGRRAAAKDEDEDDDTPPARPARGRPSVKPAARDEDDDEGDDDDDDAPPARGRKAPGVGRGRR